MSLKPLEDRVVVEPNESESVTPGGIVLPDRAKEKSQRGIVTAVGPGRILQSGERIPVGVNVGDEVLFSMYGGSDIEVGDKAVKILRETDILAVVSK